VARLGPARRDGRAGGERAARPGTRAPGGARRGHRDRSATHLYRVATGAGGQRTELSAWLVREWSGTPSNLTAGEHVAIGWFDKKDLPEPSHPLMRPALEAAIERLAL